MNPFEMVVLIVAIVMISSVVRAKYRAQGGSDKRALTESTAEAQRLREEVRALKDRVAVLERLATDDSGPRALERQIDALRSRDD